jgi:hypothetical protein
MTWSKFFGRDGKDVGHSVKKTRDGGYILIGTQNHEAFDSKLYLIKTNFDGEEEWSQTYNGDNGFDVEQTFDDGYIVVGDVKNYIYLIKTDSQGREIWSKTFERIGWNPKCSIQQTSDSGYIIVSSTVGSIDLSGIEPMDIYLIKTDSNGNELWNIKYGGTGDDFGYAVQQTSDDGFIIVGSTQKEGQGADRNVFLLKTDAHGEI